MAGIKETKEAIVGVNEISLVLCERFKDGVGVDDGLAIYTKIISDEAFKSKVIAAYDNYKAIPEEIKDIDLAEGSELAITQISYLPKFVEALKK